MSTANVPSATDAPRDYAALFEAHLRYLERVLATVSHVLGFGRDDAQEFAAWALERLWRDDYAILRKWRGESRLTTYLGTVVVNLGREFRVQRWGRWRPSAAAVRLGAVAVRLERFVYRDGLSLSEAGRLLRASGATDLSDRALATVLAEVPQRTVRRAAEPGALDGLPDARRTDDEVLLEERDGARRAAYATLADALGRLASEEGAVLRLHFLQGLTLAEVARALSVPQKPLYRLRDRALATLRAELTASGLTADAVRDLLGGALDARDARDEEASDDAAAGRGNPSPPRSSQGGAPDPPAAAPDFPPPPPVVPPRA